MPFLDAESLPEIIMVPALREHVFLEGERAREAEMTASKKNFGVTQRALHGFVFLRDEKPIYIVPFELPDDFWKNTGHWADRSVTPVLISIETIVSLDSRSDPAFRQGQECLWLRSSGYEYALLDPFSFFGGQWEFTCAGYLAPAFQAVNLNDSPPAWWPAEKRSVWVQLKGDQRFSALPDARKKMMLEYTSSHPGQSPFEPQLFSLEKHHYEKGKRPASEMAPDETSENSFATLGRLSLGEAKRSRREAESLVEFLNESLQLEDHPISRSMQGFKDGTNYYVLPWSLEKSNSSSNPHRPA